MREWNEVPTLPGGCTSLSVLDRFKTRYLYCCNTVSLDPRYTPFTYHFPYVPSQVMVRWTCGLYPAPVACQVRPLIGSTVHQRNPMRNDHYRARNVRVPPCWKEHTHSHSFTLWITVWNHSSHCDSHCEWVWMSVFFPFPVIHTVNHCVKRIDHNVKTPQFNILEHTVIHTVNECVLSFSDYPHCEPQCETNRPQCENAPI